MSNTYVALRRAIIDSGTPRGMAEEVLAELWRPGQYDTHQLMDDRDFLIVSVSDALMLAHVGATLDLADSIRDSSTA